MAGAGKFIDDAFQYIRGTKGAFPDTGRGYMMFVHQGSNPEQTAESIARTYGKNLWKAAPVDAVSADDLKDLVREQIDNDPEFVAKLGIDEDQVDQFIDEINPQDIVDSAGVFDSDAVYPIYEEILAPRGYRSVVTNDGLIVFDPSDVMPYGVGQSSKIAPSLGAVGLVGAASQPADAMAYSNAMLGQSQTPEWQATTAPGAAMVHGIGSKLLDMQLPGNIRPFEGIGEYLINYGYDDPYSEKLKRAFWAGMDFL